MKIVYLAGGFRGGWHEKVMLAAPDAKYLDPRTHGYKSEKLYTEWDLEAVSVCDIVFAYLSAENPSGFGMSIEMGYAARARTPIFFVDEKSPVYPDMHRNFGMHRQISFVHFSKLEDGIAALQQMLEAA